MTPAEQLGICLATAAGRAMSGIMGLRRAIDRERGGRPVGVASVLRGLLGLRSTSLGFLAALRRDPTAPDYVSRAPRWYAVAWPLPCSRPGCGMTTCRHARPAHEDRAERKRARRLSR